MTALDNAVRAGWKRNATAIGTRKYVSRASEYAPPERTTSMVIAATSTAVPTSAKRDEIGLV